MTKFLLTDLPAPDLPSCSSLLLEVFSAVSLGVSQEPKSNTQADR